MAGIYIYRNECCLPIKTALLAYFESSLHTRSRYTCSCRHILTEYTALPLLPYVLLYTLQYEVQYVTEENLSEFTIHDVVIPLPGYDVLLPKNRGKYAISIRSGV